MPKSGTSLKWLEPSAPLSAVPSPKMGGYRIEHSALMTGTLHFQHGIDRRTR
jgi:hypothetical protein